MRPFTNIVGIAASLPQVNVDTDKIIPAKFLKTVDRKGLGRGLFFAMRFDADEKEVPEFVLNRLPWRDAEILIAGDNFGCGSSREHAPWALTDFGFRCIIAPSFADIFYNNCFKNGILPINLDMENFKHLQHDAENIATATMTVDLHAQTITRTNGTIIKFDVDEERKRVLIEGLDEISVSLSHLAEIINFENQRRNEWPWLPKIPLEMDFPIEGK
jgi:3-isopropylmalate/(R)-2-methylmalate dehydratase small subunit